VIALMAPRGFEPPTPGLKVKRLEVTTGFGKLEWGVYKI